MIVSHFLSWGSRSDIGDRYIRSEKTLPPRRKPGDVFRSFFSFFELGKLMGIGGQDIRSGKALPTRGKVGGILFVSFSPNFLEMGESMGYRRSGY